MTKNELEWIVIDDFTAGIWSDRREFLGGGGTRAPGGAANPTNTYGCRSLASGALGPMPARYTTYDFEDFPDAGNGNRYFLCGMNGQYGYVSDQAGGGSSADRTAIHLGVYYIDSGGERVYKWMRHRIYTPTPAIETLKTVTTSGESETTISPRQASIFGTRMNPTTPTSPGAMVIAHVFTGLPAFGAESLAAVHPDPATPTTNATLDIGTTRDYVRAVGHQNRIVMTQLVFYDLGVNTLISTIDNWWYTDPNDNSLTNTIADFFTTENPTSIADFGSMTANELVVIKSQGGGFVIRGAIENPTVIQLPNLYSPLDGFEAVFRGVNTTAGFLYSGGHGGVYLWDGGERSTDISPNMDGAFWWRDIDSKYAGMGRWLEGQGQCAQWHDLTVIPRLWCWDNTTGGWWRLENPADVDADDDLLPIHASVSNYFGRLYLSKWTVTEAVPEYLYVYQPDTAREDYSWESHPLATPNNRRVRAREIVVVAQGDEQTLTVTITNEAGATDTATWTLNSTEATVLRQPVNLQGKDFKFRIQTDGTAESNPAGIIHELRIGMDQARHIENS